MALACSCRTLYKAYFVAIISIQATFCSLHLLMQGKAGSTDKNFTQLLQSSVQHLNEHDIVQL